MYEFHYNGMIFISAIDSDKVKVYKDGIKIDEIINPVPFRMTDYIDTVCIAYITE